MLSACLKFRMKFGRNFGRRIDDTGSGCLIVFDLLVSGACGTRRSNHVHSNRLSRN